MKKFFTLIFHFFSFYAQSQVFSGSGGAIQNNGVETYFTLVVSGLSQSQLNGAFGIEEVCININHPAVQELQIYLQSPAGMIVELTDGNNCSGTNYTNTCFNNAAGTSITLGTAPFSGTFRPVGFLGRFNNSQAGNGAWKLIVKDYLAFVNAGVLFGWSVKFGNTPAAAVVFGSSDLPIVVINTNSQAIGDVKIMADMGIIYNGSGVRNYMTDAMNNYNGKVHIRFRGNTSRFFEKKPYTFETCDAAGTDLLASLLGMPVESEWHLIAMYQDKSLIRVPITYDLSRKMGRYAPRFKMTEVVLNNEYQGVYALVEKPKRDQNRIDISKLSPTENSGTAVTGGYILKIDRADEPGWSSLLPGDAQNGAHFYYQYVYPKDSITIPQRDYIKSFVDSFETAMAAPYFSDPWAGYQRYMDLGSLVDFFIMNELSKNVDAYRLSTYLYKDKVTKGGKLHIGPVWDYDLAWHNCNYGNSFDPTGWQYQLTDTVYPTPTWWSRLMQDTNFVNTLYCRWTQLRQGVFSDNSLYAYVDSAALALSESQQRNFTQWPVLGAYIAPNPQNQSGANYQSEVTDLKSWIGGRVGWMDWAITGHCPVIGVEEIHGEHSVVVYPNPSLGMVNVQWLMSNGSTAVLTICNVLGEKIFTSAIHDQPSTQRVDLSDQPKGIYFYQLKIDNGIQTGKIIIQ